MVKHGSAHPTVLVPISAHGSHFMIFTSFNIPRVFTAFSTEFCGCLHECASRDNSWGSPKTACAVLVVVQECWSVVCIAPHDTDVYHERCIQKFMRGMSGKNYDP